jgi:hypothetical protein
MSSFVENVDEFRTHPVYALSALMPDRDCAEKAVELSEADDEPQVLHGDEGLRILDQRGDAHGLAARWHRLLQQWTYYEEILELYVEGIRRGEYLVVLSSPPERRHELARAVHKHGAHAIYYFGFNTLEEITAP